MEQELSEINTVFQCGKHKQAIVDLQTLIDKYSIDDEIYKAYLQLGNYLNFMGEQVQAVEAWTNALNILENSIEDSDVSKLNEAKLIDWINISIATARVLYRQGQDGSGVSHKYNSVCYEISKLNENEEIEWKKERFQKAIKHYKQAIDHLFDDDDFEIKRKFRIELAEVLFDAANYDEAVQIYEDAFNNDGDAEWLYKAANCSWQQGNKKQAYIRLQQLIATEPTFAKAYKMCADYFKEKNDPIQADEYTHQYEFYTWIPSFCHHIEYNTENIRLLKTIQSNKALECIETILIPDLSKRSTEFLAAICYNHYHGPVEDKAFEELEYRGKTFLDGNEKDFIGTILMHLITKHQSICTIKGAANALAGMKHEQIFEILANLLPQDLNPFFPMNIPNALAKLGDPRAIPLLIRMIEEPISRENDADDDDAWEKLFSSGGTDQLTTGCCLALSAFFHDLQVKEVLLNGIHNEEICQACLAVLSINTGEKQFFDKLEKMLIEDGHTFDYQVLNYLQDHTDQFEQIDRLLKLNEDIYKKKDIEND